MLNLGRMTRSTSTYTASIQSNSHQGPEAVADKLEGAHPAELAKKIQALAASAGSTGAAAPLAAAGSKREEEAGAANGGAAATGNVEERCVGKDLDGLVRQSGTYMVA